MLTRQEIAEAECIIVAADKNIEMARFDGKPVIKTQVANGIKDGKVYMFDPYYQDIPYDDYPEVQVVMDHPFEYNRIVPVELFNTTELKLYAFGPVEEREAVLLGNKNTLLTAEKTIEYFI